MRRTLILWPVMALGMIFSVCQAQTTAVEWKAKVGGQSFDGGMQALAFLPNEMWIHVGDSITWTFSANENHSVTFLKDKQTRPTFAAGCPPSDNTLPNGTTPNGSTFNGMNCVNSGLIATPGTTYTVNFSAPGNFVIVCLLHVNQSGTIHVLDPSVPFPHDQAFYDRQAAAEEHDLLVDRDGGLAAKLREDVAKGSDDDDAHGHAHQGMNIVVMGAGEYAPTPGGAQSVSRMRFGRESITIHAGDTVEWASSDVSGHSVQFGPGEFGPLDPLKASPNVVVSRDADGTLHAILTSPSDDLCTTSCLYTGRLAPQSQERTGSGQLAPGATRFRVTFTTQGRYPYICAYHDEIGMKGEVIVLP